MNRLGKSGVLVFVALSLTSPMLSGCSDVELRYATQKFDASVQSSVVSIRSYYVNLNESARNEYFDEVRFEPTKLMSTFNEENGERQQTALKNLFDPQYIEARLKVLTLLANYSKGLGLLAASNAPKQVREELEAVDANIKQIESDINSLSGSSSSEVGEYAGFVTTIGGIAMENILEMKKDEAIRKYVAIGDEPTKNIFALLEKDLKSLSENYHRAGSAHLSRYVKYYNRNFTTTTDDSAKIQSFPIDPARLSFLAETKKAATDLAMVKDSDPARLVASLRKAHNNLVNCAVHDCRTSDVASRVLNDSSDVLAQASRISDAIAKLQTGLK